MLYKKRMERELLRAKGLLKEAEKPPEEVRLSVGDAWHLPCLCGRQRGHTGPRLDRSILARCGSWTSRYSAQKCGTVQWHELDLASFFQPVTLVRLLSLPCFGTGGYWQIVGLSVLAT